MLKATRKDFHLAVLQVSFQKKKQEIHREGTVTEIWLSVLLVQMRMSATETV